jgi:hypothetical protein
MSGPDCRLAGIAALLLVSASCGLANVYWLHGRHDMKEERERSRVVDRPLAEVWSASERRLADLKARCFTIDRPGTEPSAPEAQGAGSVSQAQSRSGIMTCSLPAVAGSHPHDRRRIEGVTYVTVLLSAVSSSSTRVRITLLFRSREPDPRTALLHSNGRFEREFFAAIAAAGREGR